MSSSSSSSSSSIESLVVTFNCGRELINAAVFGQHLARAAPAAQPLILALCLQEIAPIAHSFLGGGFIRPYLDRVRAAVDVASEKWGGPEYVLVAARHVGMTAAVVLVRSDFRDRVETIDVGGVGVGWYEMGNKGAVGVNLRLRRRPGGVSSSSSISSISKLKPRSAPDSDSVQVMFVAAHLAPMEWNLQRRNDDWRRIVEGLVLEPLATGKTASKASRRSDSAAAAGEEQPLLGGQDSDDASDDAADIDNTGTDAGKTTSGLQHTGIYSPGRHVVVAGDLNYRTSDSGPRPSSRAMFPHLLAPENSPHHYRHLLPCDQLAREMEAGRTLQGFDEAAVTFAPTYKYSGAAQHAMLPTERSETKSTDAGGEGGGDAAEDSADAADSTDDPSSPSPADFPWSPHRWPSWCDRILFLSGGGGGSNTSSTTSSSSSSSSAIRPLRYTSLPLMSTSDHQPVVLHLQLPWSVVSSRHSDVNNDNDDGHRSDDHDIHTSPPYQIDPTWRARRLAAHRLELATGAAAWLGTTWEGGAVALALVAAGSLGGWLAVSRLLW